MARTPTVNVDAGSLVRTAIRHGLNEAIDGMGIKPAVGVVVALAKAPNPIDDFGGVCLLCGARDTAPIGAERDRQVADHAETCPWRRAVEWRAEYQGKAEAEIAKANG